MSEESGDNSVLRGWVRKQLEAGDDPKVLKTALKNRGMDPAIVDDVLSSITIKKNPPAKKAEVSLSEPKKTFINTTLRDDVEKILFSAKPDSSAKHDLNSAENSAGSSVEPSDAIGGKVLMAKKASGKGLHAKKENKKSEENISETVEIKEYAAKKAQLEQNPVVEKESIFSLFKERAREYLSGIKFGPPKITEYIFDTRIVLLTGIAAAILIIALLASFGLNWYADRVAKSVLK